MFISIKNAVKVYGKNDASVSALDHMDLELEEGKIYVVLGPSGSGKSTLLNVIGGLDTVDSGQVSIGGVSLTDQKNNDLTKYRRDTVGFVFQFYNLIPDLTLKENIESVRELSDNPFEVSKMLESLGISKYADRFPNELSGGQQQRAAIARALVKNPKILLCDEPTGALDTKSSRMVLECIENIHKEFGTTIIIVTHNEGIAEMAQSVIRLHDGKVEVVEENPDCKSAKDISL